MAISATKSPNPSLRPNSNPRNSENSPMRRSFTGNPFQKPSVETNPRGFVPSTPANSPADILNRNSLWKEEKENEKENQNLKPTRARSPAVPKGTNHFMIPTISAASKINPSPRKKVLADRNEPIRTSLSSSYEKIPLFSKNLTDNLEDLDKKDSEIDHSCNHEDVLKTPPNFNLSPKIPSQIPFLTPPNFSESSDVKKPIFSSTKAFASSMSPNIAPLDANPSLPPYDPKTNFLSPRPQFLHYKPNPRLEPYSSGTNNLEESFLSESLSDTEVSDESEPENSPKESEKEERDASPVKVINENMRKESEDASPKLEPITIPTSTNVSKVPDEEKRAAKSRFLTRGKFLSLLLVFLVGCLSVPFIDSPRFDLPVYENLRSYKFYEEGFYDFGRNLKVWSIRSTSYVNELIRSLNGVEKLGPLQFYNLTYTLDDLFNNVKRFEEIYEQDEEEEPVFEDEDESESILDLDLDNELDFEEELSLETPELGPEESDSQQLEQDDDELISDSGIESSTGVSSLENTFRVETSASVSVAQSSEQVDHLIADAETLFQVDSEFNSQTIESKEIKQESPVISDSEIEATKLGSDSENIIEMDAYTSDLTPEYQSAEPYKTLAMSLLALVSIAATFLIYFKNKNANTSNSKVETEKEMNLDPQSCESYASEMSSFSYSERKQKRSSKRESLASSLDFAMSDSPSYGSFTTYERLPSKHGYGDDEVATPVRRSSRIKKIQVTPL